MHRSDALLSLMITNRICKLWVWFGECGFELFTNFLFFIEQNKCQSFLFLSSASTKKSEIISSIPLRTKCVWCLRKLIDVTLSFLVCSFKNFICSFEAKYLENNGSICFRMYSLTLQLMIDISECSIEYSQKQFTYSHLFEIGEDGIDSKNQSCHDSDKFQDINRFVRWVK